MTPICRRLAVLCCIAAAPAAAGTLEVEVSDTQGAPVSDAVVTLVAPPGAVHQRPPPATRIIDQRDETFIPYVEVFRPGDRVQFSNNDDTRHHVYSFSPVRKFDLVLAPGESGPALDLERAGVVAVGCNIHDHMIAYLFVSDAALAARTERGRARFDGLPAGQYAVRVWHPQLRRDQPEQAAKVAADATARVAITLALLPDPRVPPDPERSGY